MSPPDHWLRLEELFEVAVTLDDTERRQYLRRSGADDKLCAEVEALVRAERRSGGDGFITGVIGEAVRDLVAVEAASWVGRTVGRYRLVAELARGGMGTVYLAERADASYRAQVAIKFVRGAVAGSELVRRFLAERQILANLAHPNIARLLDGGTTDDGTPYLVMEHIEGEPIDAYCDRRPLNLQQRLTLFRQVCDAVQYAHRHLVVHRDIKPSNILVTADGTPKLLDFGVAKLLDPVRTEAETVTGTEDRLLTPAYASPEQVRGETITTATDVYSLGVLLYRILAGSLPYGATDLARHELAQAIVAKEPVPPSRAVGRDGSRDEQIGRDLDAVVLTALDKDPARRYASVERFGADVLRYLRGLPVQARPATRAYRTRKFVARHRQGVLAGITTLGMVVTLTGFYVLRLARERDFADAEGRKTAQVAAFLERLFRVADPSETRGETITAREVVDSAVARLPTELADQPEIQAAMLYTLGGVYHNLGLYDDALPLLERGLALRRDDPQRGSPSVGDFLARLGSVALLSGQFDSAATILDNAARRLEIEYPRENRSVLARVSLANALRRAGRLDEADTVLSTALVSARELPGDSALDIVLATQAALYLNQRRGAEAEAIAREAWERQRDRFGADAPRTIVALNNIAQALFQLTRYAEAEPLMQEVLTLRRRVVGENHPTTGTAWNNLAALYQAQGRYVEAAEAARHALEIYRANFGERHQRVTLAMTNLASILLAAGETSEAERLHRDALQIKLDMLPPGHIDIAVSYNNLARVLEEEGRLPDAVRSYRQALDVIEQGVGIESGAGSIFLTNLGGALEQLGRADEAETTLRRSLAIQRDVFPPQHARTATTLTRLGGLLLRTQRAAEAEPLLREALEMQTALLGPDHWEIQVTRNLIGGCLAALDQPTAAESLLTTSSTALWTRFGPDDRRARTALERTALFYETVGNRARARAVRSRLNGVNPSG